MDGFFRTSAESVCRYFKEVVKPLYLYESASEGVDRGAEEGGAEEGGAEEGGAEEGYIYCLRSRSEDDEGVVVIGRAKGVECELEALNRERPDDPLVLTYEVKTLNSKRDEWLAHRHFSGVRMTTESVRRYFNDVVWPLYYYEYEHPKSRAQ